MHPEAIILLLHGLTHPPLCYNLGYMPKIIETNPKVLGGQPVIRNTRIPVSRILALVGMDYKLSDIKSELPQLRNMTRNDLGQILGHYKTQVAA